MYTKEEMLAVFDVIGFGYGYCVVRRKSDGVKGTLYFTTNHATPRTYFGFMEV